MNPENRLDEKSGVYPTAYTSCEVRVNFYTSFWQAQKYNMEHYRIVNPEDSVEDSHHLVNSLADTSKNNTPYLNVRLIASVKNPNVLIFPVDNRNSSFALMRCSLLRQIQNLIKLRSLYLDLVFNFEEQAAASEGWHSTID